MNVYVAGKAGAGIESVRILMKALREAGHTVTYDWTEADVRKPFHENAGRCMGEAKTMLDGVRKAELLIFNMQSDVYGAMVELGAALALDIPVILVDDTTWGEKFRDSLFFYHPNVTVVGLDEVRDLVRFGKLPGQQGRGAVAMRCG